MTAATGRTRPQPVGPQPDGAAIAGAYREITYPEGPLAGFPAVAIVAATMESVLRLLAEEHRDCQTPGCYRCGLLRHGLAYLYALGFVVVQP
jgi:hypothetical protein